jgi:hypothetical protein
MAAGVAERPMSREGRNWDTGEHSHAIAAAGSAKHFAGTRRWPVLAAVSGTQCSHWL